MENGRCPSGCANPKTLLLMATRNPARKPVEVGSYTVIPQILQGLYIAGGAEFLPSTVPL